MNLTKITTIHLTSLFFIMVCSFNFRDVGGIQLLMSLEQQKKTERLVNYFDDDLKGFYNSIDTTLYYFNWLNNKKRKEEVLISQDFREVIFQKSKDLHQSYDKLSEAFKSIYFVFEADDYSKKYFAPINILNTNLASFNENFGRDYLFDLHDQSTDALQNLRYVKDIVKNARIANSEELKKKAKEMSVWEWIFGF